MCERERDIATYRKREREREINESDFFESVFGRFERERERLMKVIFLKVYLGDSRERERESNR